MAWTILKILSDRRTCICRCECGRLYKRDKYQIVKHPKCFECARKGTGNALYKHGLSNKHRLYRTWKNMKQRVNNKNNKRFLSYGGRGIKVCDAWENNFMAFYNWAMANGYRDDLTLDRIDNNGNYCPENCRWVDWDTQRNNTQRTKRFVWNGVEMSMKQICEITGAKYDRVKDRVRRGWSIQKAIND